MYPAVSTRIKILGGINIAERRIPQDGKISLIINNNLYDFRISTLPLIYGEKIVIRIMDYSLSGTGIENLGFSESNYNKILKIFEPTAFPNANPLSPFLHATTLVTSSGKLVPIATIVRAITFSATPSICAISVALFTTNCPPNIIPASPTKIYIISLNY